MNAHTRWTPRLILGALVILAGCAPGPNTTRVARSTLVVGIDVSGSFRANHESSIDFAANYLYARLNGLGGLKQPTALFVGAIGGANAEETKSFQPIHTFQGRSVEEIAAFLRAEYPTRDGYTDFNPFFTRVAVLVKRQGLALSPIDVVLLTDGIPDTPAEPGDSLSRYANISMTDLEYLSRTVTVRVLFPRPTVAVNWERRIPRHRVRMWTVDDEVMNTWRRQRLDSIPPEGQDALWKWIGDNVDHRVRSVGVL
ncbi:MAG: hypothetical protein WD801_12025 [Gemmatimonadaceae bacterium]